jgi:hypothetical protein
MYQCGREKAPDATNAMQAAAASNVASVSFQHRSLAIFCLSLQPIKKIFSILDLILV